MRRYPHRSATKELDAADAAQHGSLGLAVLSPLMRGATAELVEHVVVQVLDQAPLLQQADLLSILGVFAEPLIDPQEVLVRHIRTLTDLDQLAALQRDVLHAPDQAAVEALLAAVRTEG